MLLLIALVELLCVQAIQAAEPGASKWVYFGPDHRLHYATDERGNRIMDFSYAGYHGGGVALPVVAAVETLQPEVGDNTARIQTALDAVSAREIGPDGFRGAVLLAPGTFDLSGSLTIAKSGVVLRGSGSGEGGTIIRMRGTPHRLLNIRGAGNWQTDGQPIAITDAYVPSGANSFTVKAADAAAFKPGDTILVRKPVTEEWVKFMGMDADTLSRGGKKGTWLKPGTLINADRTVKAVAGYRITLDVPLSDSYDAKYLGPAGATIVKYKFPGRICNVGFESVHLDATPTEEMRGNYSLLGMSAVSDAWVRDVLVDETSNGMSIGASARRVTLERVRYRHRDQDPHMGGSSPADIAISGTQVLIDRSSNNGKKLWPIVTQATVTGPNVVLNFSAGEAGVSPHQRWATGLLVDGGQFRNNWERRPGVALEQSAERRLGARLERRLVGGVECEVRLSRHRTTARRGQLVHRAYRSLHHGNVGRLAAAYAMFAVR